jgi:hypothetical protein
MLRYLPLAPGGPSGTLARDLAQESEPACIGDLQRGRGRPRLVKEGAPCRSRVYRGNKNAGPGRLPVVSPSFYYLGRVAQIVIENKGVIDSRERSDSMLFLFSLCFP